MIRDERYGLIYYYESETEGARSGSKGDHLFDLAVVPVDVNNLWFHPDGTARRRRLLDAL